MSVSPTSQDRIEILFFALFIPTQHISEWLPDGSSKLKVLLDPARRAETKTNSFRPSLLVCNNKMKTKEQFHNYTNHLQIISSFNRFLQLGYTTIYFIYCFRLVDNRYGCGFIKEKHNTKCRILPVLFCQEEMKKRLDAEIWTWKKTLKACCLIDS